MSKEKRTESLSKKRESLKARVNHFKKHVDELLQAHGAIASNASALELAQRIARFEPLIDEFDELQIELECSSADAESQYSQREEFENEFYKTLSSAKNILDVYNRDRVETNSISNAQNVSRSPNNPSFESIQAGTPPPIQNVIEQSVQLNCIKLPTIDLPKFDGTYDAWLEYREPFDSLIHKNMAINNIQKFHYLKASLMAGALQVISSIEMTEHNYEVAWNTLCDRYNNTRLLVHNHVKALFNIDPITKESSSKIRKLMDTVTKHLRSLAVLNQPTSQWDTLIIHLVSMRLDNSTVRHWEQFKSDRELPTLEDLKQFLKSRADILETVEVTTSEKTHKTTHNYKKSYLASSTETTCIFCKAKHNIHVCQDFLGLSINARVDHVRRSKLCLNCLRGGHFSTSCKYGVCKKCGAKHHTLLHSDAAAGQSNDQGNNQRVVLSTRFQGQVLLPTALVQILDREGKPHRARALLDSGSQCSFIREGLCKKLRLLTRSIDLNVSGLSRATSKIKSKCDIQILSPYNKFSKEVNCLVLNQITGFLPNYKFNVPDYSIPRNIHLADPNFNTPGEIDILLGADNFWELLCIGQISLGKQKPTLQKTVFGWIVSGSVPDDHHNEQLHCHLSNVELSNELSRFWQLEEVPNARAYSAEEAACEQHFTDTFKRVEGGRFMVAIPFKQSLEALGESKLQAQRRFLRLERRLKNDEQLKERYDSFLTEYEELGHMTKVVEASPPAHSYYLPHHGVLKDESLTTKLRVVFDASASSSSGVSLNDIQMVGPTIQSDLFSTLLRFRSHTYVVCADIAMMYRQILVYPEQRALQRILWRANSSQPLETYQLNTITYGTACASFMAIRCLHQLALECEDHLPNVSDTIKRDFYVDDLVTGGDALEEVIAICKGVRDVLREGCFQLRKWMANCGDILKKLSEDHSSESYHFGALESTKTLGLCWMRTSDSLVYDIRISNRSMKVTKRSILSCIAQIFDPLGLLSPCVITAKIIMQELWQHNLSWDDSLPSHLHFRWLTYQEELCKVGQIVIPRHVMSPNRTSLELHCFSDASEKAYGGCIYVRSIDPEGNVVTSLYCAKTKVAPIKTLSIPRLELCGALLLSKLASKVIDSVSYKFDGVTLWTDSTVVLGWLKSQPNHLKTFVGNRIARIQALTEDYEWRHVSSEDNPADLLSRGISPRGLENASLWWNGPAWLCKELGVWPEMTFMSSSSDLPEYKKLHNLHAYQFDKSLFSRFSDFTRMTRVLALCIRFKRNISLSVSERKYGAVSVEELQHITQVILKIIQLECFPREIASLKSNQPLAPKSKLLPLNPFLDSDGLLRVGGRLANSRFCFNKIHPIILPVHHVTSLIFEHEHRRLMHASQMQLLATIRETYWPLGGRHIARKTVRSCVRCFKCKPRLVTPIMGNLPEGRCTPAAPFNTTGVDYAGPFYIRDRKGRGAKLSKGYLCLFICFAVKAVHLELASDLSKESFLSAFRRFTARRGCPTRVYSDNGTNFVGANAELKALTEFLINNQTDFENSFANKGIEWHFIPPHSPHWGGLWEAGVKSAKHHLLRVIGNSNLTYEEFYTVLVQVESVLNSRPLSPISSDPDDLLPLTPAHFLVGRPLTAAPDAPLKDIPTNRLSSIQRIQQLQQHFWMRWHKEYISELQLRRKWQEPQGQLQPGLLVLIKDDHLPPLKWSLGRILEIHPGSDGIPRVATIKTSRGPMKRSFSKICVLPINCSNQD